MTPIQENPLETAPDPDSDAALVARCLGGQAVAWELLVRRYQRLVYAIVRRTGMDDHAAADVFQNVFARLLAHLPKLKEPDRLQAWIVTTAKREALHQRGHALRTVSITGATGDDDGADWDIADEAALPEEALEALQQQHAVRLALDRIDDRCRRLLGMLFDDPDDVPPYEQIASELAIPVGSIGPTRARCLAKLRTMLSR